MRTHTIFGWLAIAGTAVHAGVGCGSDDPEVAKMDAGAEAPDAGAPEAEAPDASGEPDAHVGGGRVSVKCAVQPCATHISAGASFACAILEDRTVRCWGDDANGQLGRGDAGPPSGIPVDVPGLEDVVQISAAGTILGSVSREMACALRASGQATCWGDDSSGQLGVATVSDVRSVTAGPTTACAIRLGRGEVACFGRHATYAFEDGSRGAVSVATSLDAALLVTADRSVWSWGAASAPPDFISPLGRIVSSPTAEPGTVPDLHEISEVAASAEHACALAAAGKVYCWGNNTFGQLGSGSRAPSEVPIEVRLPDDAHAVSLALSERTTCAVTDDGRAFCWGANEIGELGYGDDAPHFAPMPVRSLGAPIVEMAAMDFTTCALLETGRILCWGYNGSGGLGIGTTDFELHPSPSAVRFDAQQPMGEQ